MTRVTSTSAKGRTALKGEEGEVLRAYRCPAGVWTIGAGLTAASGVVNPRSGMVITNTESDALLRKALERNYEPRVIEAKLTRSQHEFDGSVMFDFNTGDIDSASWVSRWLTGQAKEAQRRFKLYVKGGGRTLPGLVKRRDREWEIIENGTYPNRRTHTPAVSTSAEAVRAYQSDLAKLGYDIGPIDGKRGPKTRAAVTAFQKDKGLTVDGIVGPATRSAIKRALDAKVTTKRATQGGTGGAAAGGGADVAAHGQATSEALYWAVGIGVGAAALIVAGYLVWRYRGPLFAWLPESVKDAAENAGVTIGRRVRA